MPKRTLPDGAPRRLSDARNAWRKMSPEQRTTFRKWMAEQDLPELETWRIGQHVADVNSGPGVIVGRAQMGHVPIVWLDSDGMPATDLVRMESLRDIEPDHVPTPAPITAPHLVRGITRGER